MIDNTWILAHPWMTLFIVFSVLNLVNNVLVNLPVNFLKYLAVLKHGHPPKEN